MKKRNNLLLSFLVGFSIFASSSVALAADAAKPSTPSTVSYSQRELNEQSVLGLLWVQTSAEYRELCYQAYNAALFEVDKAVANAKPGDKPLAIILDCDETVLDNSAAQAGYLDHNDAFSDKNWNNWVNAARAEAMPGSAEFLQSVAAKGVEVFYVSNRSEKENREGTLKNMKELQFPCVDEKHVLLKTDTSNKQPRFDAVEKNYRVVVYMGDNAGDLPIGTYRKSMQERNALIDQHKKEFGARFIVLPNPEYGDWEGALAKNYWSLTPEQKSELRKSLLKKWRADETQ